MESFLIKTINPFKTYTTDHMYLINQALDQIDDIIRSESTPHSILKRLYEERLQILKQISKINGDFYEGH
ncbi:hypothetical protein [Aquimarina sp. SS2-1]|uniref:hypothetical protein n=1 Tax=Aquimarina besae TaxID=3342247 RepID=UPI003671F530